MRLICPNCDAQYDIPDEALVPDGRDVQCSNCEHTWFQELVEPPTAQTTDRELMPTKPAPPATDSTEAASEKAEDAPEAAMPGRKPLDAAVASVLQEEAELEAQARRKEASAPVETQPDLGLKGGESSPAPSTPPAAQAQETAVAAVGPRRARLPDVAEINSTMRANSDRSPEDDPGQTAQIEARARRSFGRGFTTMVVLAAVLALLYVNAPQAVEALPGAAPWINTYVDTVDQGRVWLDGQVADFLTWLDAKTAS